MFILRFASLSASKKHILQMHLEALRIKLVWILKKKVVKENQRNFGMEFVYC